MTREEVIEIHREQFSLLPESIITDDVATFYSRFLDANAKKVEYPNRLLLRYNFLENFRVHPSALLILENLTAAELDSLYEIETMSSEYKGRKISLDLKFAHIYLQDWQTEPWLEDAGYSWKEIENLGFSEDKFFDAYWDKNTLQCYSVLAAENPVNVFVRKGTKTDFEITQAQYFGSDFRAKIYHTQLKIPAKITSTGLDLCKSDNRNIVLYYYNGASLAAIRNWLSLSGKINYVTSSYIEENTAGELVISIRRKYSLETPDITLTIDINNEDLSVTNSDEVNISAYVTVENLSESGKNLFRLVLNNYGLDDFDADDFDIDLGSNFEQFINEIEHKFTQAPKLIEQNDYFFSEIKYDKDVHSYFMLELEVNSGQVEIAGLDRKLNRAERECVLTEQQLQAMYEQSSYIQFVSSVYEYVKENIPAFYDFGVKREYGVFIPTQTTNNILAGFNDLIKAAAIAEIVEGDEIAEYVSSFLESLNSKVSNFLKIYNGSAQSLYQLFIQFGFPEELTRDLNLREIYIYIQAVDALQKNGARIARELASAAQQLAKKENQQYMEMQEDYQRKVDSAKEINLQVQTLALTQFDVLSSVQSKPKVEVVE